MKAHNYVFPVVILLAATFASCATLPPIRAPEGGDARFLIWAFSDVQPRKEAERRQFELAAEDIGRQFPYLDMAIVAGDIIQG
jgi:hypothetical protein